MSQPGSMLRKLLTNTWVYVWKDVEKARVSSKTRWLNCFFGCIILESYRTNWTDLQQHCTTLSRIKMPGTNPALREKKKQLPSEKYELKKSRKKKRNCVKKILNLQPFYQINKPSQMPSSDFFCKFFARNRLAFSFFSVLPHMFFFGIRPSFV